MSKLVQMVYISRANIPSSALAGDIGPEVSKILRISRVNNRARNIVGALYFGNGYFFQCLEGEEHVLMSLYETLKQDKRHHDLRIIQLKPVEARSFGNWEMKYIPAEQQVKDLLRSYGMTEFDPYQFTEEMIRKMLGLLQVGQDAVLDENENVTRNCACYGWKLASMLMLLSLLMVVSWKIFV